MKFHDADEILGLEALKLFPIDRFGDENYPEAAFTHLCRRNRPKSDQISNLFFEGFIGVEEYFKEMSKLIELTRRDLLNAEFNKILSANSNSMAVGQ